MPSYFSSLHPLSNPSYKLLQRHCFKRGTNSYQTQQNIISLKHMPHVSIALSPSFKKYTLYDYNVGEGDGTPLQYSCLENPMDRGAWQAAVHGVMKSRTQLSDFTFTFPFHALQKEVATHSSVLAWRIPGMGEPGRRPSMGSHRVGHD